MPPAWRHVVGGDGRHAGWRAVASASNGMVGGVIVAPPPITISTTQKPQESLPDSTSGLILRATPLPVAWPRSSRSRP